ncbi:MAG: tetratricopeptide repeat protein [Candidatus Heimdallarchaeota archaeon]|nr:tetratricopeptide repeat protein [Candidatus Heimdallarchaeota archaeon]
MFEYIKGFINRLISQKEIPQKDESLERIKKLIDESEFEKALEIIEKIEQAPDITTEQRLNCMILRSNVFNNISKYEEGLEIAQQAFQESQTISNDLITLDALIAIGDQLYRLGRFKEGLEFIEKGEELLTKVKKEIADSVVYEREYHLLNRKGTFINGMGNLEGSINCFKKCLSIVEKYDNKNLIAASLNNIGLTYFFLGKMDLALDNLQENLFITNELNDRVSLGLAFNNIGRVYSFKGELDVALEYLKKGLKLHQETGNKLFTAASLFYLGKVYQRKGDFQESFDHYKKSLKIRTEIGNTLTMSECLFELISLTIDHDRKVDKGEEYYEQLQELNKAEDNIIIDQRTRVAEALFLQSSTRALQKARAQQIFKDIAEEEIVDYELSVFSMMRLFELLLYELRASENEEVLEELKALSEKILQIAKDHNSFPVLAETYLLQSKLALLELEVDKSLDLLDSAMMTAQEKGLNYLAKKISLEKETFKEELSKWQELANRNASIQERFALAQIDETVVKSFSKEAASSVQLLEKTDVEDTSFDKKMISMIAYRFEKRGVRPFMNSGNKVLDKKEMTKFGTFLSISVALGTEYHTGLYGPLPVTGHPNYECLVYAEMVSDPDVSDPRLKKQNYLILSFVYPKKIANYLLSHRNEIGKVFEKNITGSISIEDISIKMLKNLENELEGILNK